MIFNCSLVAVVPSEEDQKRDGFIKPSYNKVLNGVSSLKFIRINH